MHYAFPFLPLEVQTSIKEIIALGTIPENAIDLLIERTSKALESKITHAQREVIAIGESADRRVEQTAQIYEDRLRLILGDTNGMLADVRTAVQGQEAAVGALRAEFHTFGETVSDRLSEIERRTDALEQTTAQHGESRDQSIRERTLLRQDMDESKAHRARMQARLDTDLPAIFNELAALSAAVKRMEQTLEVAGNHHLDQHNRHEAGG